MTVRVHIPDNPFAPSIDVAPEQWDYADCQPGQTLREICGDAPIVALCDGREMSELAIERAHLKSGSTVYVRPVPQAAAIVAAAATAASATASAASALATWSTVGYVALSAGLSITGPLTTPEPE